MLRYNIEQMGNIIKLNKNGISNSKIKGEEEMSNIRYREKEKRYEARFYVNKKMYSVYSKNKSLLKNKIKEKTKEISEQKNTISTNLTLYEYFKIWFEKYKKPFLSKKSLDNIEIYFNKHILSKIGDIKLKNFTSIILQDFLNLIERSRTKEFIALYLKAIFKKAYIEDLIIKDFSKNLILEKKLNIKKDAFIFEEQEKILKAISCNSYKNYFMIYLLTGVRKEEIKNIIEINENKNTIKVVCEKKDKYTTKIINLTPYTINLIKASDLINIKTKTLYDNFKLVLKGLNINGSLHSLRHTYAVNNYYLKNPIKHIQTWLGHSNINITMNIYVGIDDTLTADKIKQLYNNTYYIIENN